MKHHHRVALAALTTVFFAGCGLGGFPSGWASPEAGSSPRSDDASWPTATNDRFTGAPSATISGNILGNDRDPNGSTLVVDEHTQPANGSLVLRPDGSFTYTARQGYEGRDGFGYTVANGRGGRTTAWVEIDVHAEVPSTPVATSDYYVGPRGTPLSGNLLENDSDPFGFPLTVVSHTRPAHGSLTVNPDGSFLYAPNQGAAFWDIFAYTVDDGHGGAATTEATIAVGDSGEWHPIATPSLYEGLADGHTAGNLFADGFSREGAQLVAVNHTQATHVPTSLNRDDGFAYAPQTGWAGFGQLHHPIKGNHGGMGIAVMALLISWTAGATGKGKR